MIRHLAVAAVVVVAYPPGDPDPPLIPPAVGCWDPSVPFEDCTPPPAAPAVPAGVLPATR